MSDVISCQMKLLKKPKTCTKEKSLFLSNCLKDMNGIGYRERTVLMPKWMFLRYLK